MRTLVNKTGVTYDAAKTKILFAEDWNELKDIVEDLQLLAGNFGILEIDDDYTLEITDNKYVFLVDSSDPSVEITIPTHATVALPIGTEIQIIRRGSAEVDIIADLGVNLISYEGLDRLLALNARASLIKLADDEWYLGGQLKSKYEAETAAFIAAAGLSSSLEKFVLNNTVIALKAGGLWDKCIAIYPIVGGSDFAHKFNLKNPLDTSAAFRLEYFGGITHSAQGMLFNGSSGYADTFIVPMDDLTLNNTHMSVTTNNSVNDGVQIGSYDSVNGTMLLFMRVSGITISDMYNTSTQRITASVGSSIGTVVATRSGANVYKLFRGTSQLGSTNTTTGTGMDSISRNLYLGALNQDGVSAYHSASQITFATVGEGLSDAEALDLISIIAAHNTALGR